MRVAGQVLQRPCRDRLPAGWSDRTGTIPPWAILKLPAERT